MGLARLGARRQLPKAQARPEDSPGLCSRPFALSTPRSRPSTLASVQGTGLRPPPRGSAGSSGLRLFYLLPTPLLAHPCPFSPRCLLSLSLRQTCRWGAGFW